MMNRPSKQPKPKYNLLSLGESKISNQAKQRILDYFTKPTFVNNHESRMQQQQQSPVSRDEAVHFRGGMHFERRKTTQNSRREGAKTSTFFYGKQTVVHEGSSRPISIDKTPGGENQARYAATNDLGFYKKA
jgi:hypothetical protein